MRFKALPVTSLEDVTVNFEQLSGKDILDQTAENFLRLVTAGVVTANGGKVNAVFPGASTQTTPVVVSHGLTNPARTPAIIQATSTNANVHYAITAASTTTITVTGETLDGSSPVNGTTIPFFWLVIG